MLNDFNFEIEYQAFIFFGRLADLNKALEVIFEQKCYGLM